MKTKKVEIILLSDRTAAGTRVYVKKGKKYKFLEDLTIISFYIQGGDKTITPHLLILGKKMNLADKPWDSEIRTTMPGKTDFVYRGPAAVIFGNE